MKNTLFYTHALTPLHIGTGDSVDVIDKPIARNKTTGLPHIPGSGIKGVIREYATLDPNEANRPDWTTLLGPDSRDAQTEGKHFAGALNVQDGHLLCMPVRSVKGTFAWVTSPLVLYHYQRELAEYGVELDLALLSTLTDEASEQALVCEQSALVVRQTVDGNTSNTVFLEDLDLIAHAEAGVNAIAQQISAQVFPGDAVWQGLFEGRFLIVPDDVLVFLAETATDIRARVRMEAETKTVAEGALWYEENLPSETLCWNLISVDRSRDKSNAKSDAELLAAFSAMLPSGQRLQFGGNATVGRGQVKCYLISNADSNAAEA